LEPGHSDQALQAQVDVQRTLNPRVLGSRPRWRTKRA